MRPPAVYSSRIFAAFTTGRQRSISAAMRVPPSFSSRALTSADASALLISSFSRAAMAGRSRSRLCGACQKKC
jgi:hypothetical protein